MYFQSDESQIDVPVWLMTIKIRKKKKRHAYRKVVYDKHGVFNIFQWGSRHFYIRFSAALSFYGLNDFITCCANDQRRST